MVPLFRNVSITIWQKLLLAMGVTLALFYVSLLLIAQSIVAHGFNQLERQNIKQYMQRAERELSENFELLASVNRDWDVWEASYWALRYAASAAADDPTQGRSDQTADLIVGLGDLEELTQDALNNLGIDFIVFMQMDGSILFCYGTSANGGFAKQLPAEISDTLQKLLIVEQFPLFPTPNSPNLGVFDLVRYTISGFLETPQDLVALSAHYLPTSSFVAAGQTLPTFDGVVIFGDLMNDESGRLLSESLQTHVSFYPLNTSPTYNARTSQDFSQDLADAAVTYPNFVVDQSDQNHTVGYTLLANLYGEPTIGMEITVERTIYQQGQTTASLLVFFMTAAGIVFSGVIFGLIQRLLVGRITNLSREVNAIDAAQASSQAITISNHQDELSQLAQSIQYMVERLNATQAELTEKNATLAVALNQAQQVSRLKSEFLMMISHELRSPLNIIMGYTGLMKEGMAGKLDPTVKELVEIVYINSSHLLKLINALLDLSRLETGRLKLVEEDVNLHKIFDQVTHDFQAAADEKGLAFEVEIAPDIPACLRGDSTRIQQIINHLVSNAIKFTTQGKVLAQAQFDESGLHLWVKDTGIGIPPHALNLIFEEFRQVDGSLKRSYEGAGMGLAITYRLVATMRGKITVESAVGVGSTFVVLLPLKAVEHSAKLAIDEVSP